METNEVLHIQFLSNQSTVSGVTGVVDNGINLSSVLKDCILPNYLASYLCRSVRIKLTNLALGVVTVSQCTEVIVLLVVGEQLLVCNHQIKISAVNQSSIVRSYELTILFSNLEGSH